MKRAVVFVEFVAVMLLAVLTASCEGRSGYYDPGQQDVIDMLTGTEWEMVSLQYADGEETTCQPGTDIYRFERSGRGWNRIVRSLWEPPLEDMMTYFDWTFTNDTFAVIFMTDGYSGTYWLIKKLTATELHVQSAPQDPVIYPGTSKTFCKFKARKK